MSNPMICRSFNFYIILVGRCIKMVFPHITNSGKNPLNIIPMDLGFPIIPMLMIFLRIFISSSFLCSYLLSIGLLSGGFFHLCLSVNHLTAISFNNIFLFYVINRFWKGNGYFLKQIKNFFIKNFSPALIISLE